ncbi:MAG: hypothetical protein OIF58_14990 [Cohaesibacter sp.]|nr:hypothetical protein [Cohaesibacter sp.]
MQWTIEAFSSHFGYKPKFCPDLSPLLNQQRLQARRELSMIRPNWKDIAAA